MGVENPRLFPQLSLDTQKPAAVRASQESWNAAPQALIRVRSL